MRIGFIGLGSMGLPIASNLIKAQHVLTVYNRTRSRAEELQPLGAKIAETPSEAASDCEALITMLSDDRAVEEIVFTQGKTIEALPSRRRSHLHEHDQRGLVSAAGRGSS